MATAPSVPTTPATPSRPLPRPPKLPRFLARQILNSWEENVPTLDEYVKYGTTRLRSEYEKLKTRADGLVDSAIQALTKQYENLKDEIVKYLKS